MAYVVEINGRDLPNAAVADEPLLFSFGATLTFTDNAPANGGAIEFDWPSQRIDISKTGTVTSATDAGSITIANAPRDITTTGPWDHLHDWAWQDREAKLYWVPANVWADKVLTARGVLQNPVAVLSVGDAVEASIRFPLLDPRAALKKPLQTTKFAGDNVAPAGIEGDADLKGKPKPILLGIASNFKGVLVNKSKLIYQLHDAAATVMCVRDGGIPLTAGTSRANTASMEATAPAAGSYDYCSISTGTYVRLGAPAQFQLTFDAKVGAAEANRTHAQVWKTLRVDRAGTASGDINAASVTTVDTSTDKEVGWWFDQEITCADALDKVLASLSGYEVQALDGTWSIHRLQAPSGTPALSVVQVKEDIAFSMTSSDRELTSLQRARPAYAPDGAPPYRVNVRGGFNNTVMNPSDFAGVAAPRLKEKFKDAWRVETATDTAVWDPSTGAGAYPNAPELTIDTGYQPGADTLTCPHAATEASRLLALYGGLPVQGQYEVGCVPEPGDSLLPGAVVSLTYGGDGLSAGVSFIALQSRRKVTTDGESLDMILGLQT